MPGDGTFPGFTQSEKFPTGCAQAWGDIPDADRLYVLDEVVVCSFWFVVYTTPHQNPAIFCNADLATKNYKLKTTNYQPKHL